MRGLESPHRAGEAVEGREVSQGREAETARWAPFLPRGGEDPARVSPGDPGCPSPGGCTSWALSWGLPREAPRLFVGRMR